MSNDQYDIVVLGSGISGIGAAVLAKTKGYRVLVSDLGTIAEKNKQTLKQYDIPWEEGGHTLSLVIRADEVIKSPGIPNEAPVIEALEAKGVPIISEIEFARRFTDAKMICITGSNGKTTTTSLIYYMLKNAGLNVGLAGNIGQSLAFQVATGHYDYFVVELSSFQLDDMYDFKADVAILLNITPDHLDRYNYQFQNYVDAKFRITRNQTADDVFIYWSDDPVITAELSKRDIPAKKWSFALHHKQDEKAYMKENKLFITMMPDQFSIPREEIALQGIHNLYNSMAAGLAASSVHVKKELIRASFQSFQGVPHRLEYVATVRGVRFVNDSKATNVNSCWYALESMQTPVVLILGGVDKGNNYAEIETLVDEKVHTLIFMGVDNSKLHAFFDSKGKKIIDVQSMKEAVEKAYANAHKGDTVLLSPCCASFDLFKNYEDRGDQFKMVVRHL
ncbi:MAG: UDP-N-acetylmuramoyl-L-alanine--D-glutamate ligase [Microbacter sp.]